MDNPLLRLINDGERVSGIPIPDDTHDPAAMREYADALAAAFRACSFITKALYAGLGIYSGADILDTPGKIRRWADITERANNGIRPSAGEIAFMRDFYHEVDASGAKIHELAERLAPAVNAP